MKHSLSALLVSGAALCAADASRPIEDAAARFENTVAKLPAALRTDFRFQGADALLAQYPTLAARLVRAQVDETRGEGRVALGSGAMRTLAALDPDAAAALAPRLEVAAKPGLIRALIDTKHPELAIKVFQSTADTFDAKNAPSIEIWQFLNGVLAISQVAKDLAAEQNERIAKIVAGRSFGEKPQNAISGTFSIDGKTIETDNAKDTLLVVAGSRLSTLDAGRFKANQALFAKWDLTAKVSIRGLTMGSQRPASDASLSRRMVELRGNLSDEARSKLAIELAKEIGALSGPARASMAQSLRSLATEGDLGPQALAAVAETLGAAMKETPSASGWISLADLIHYEHVKAPVSDPALDAALALLEMRDTVLEAAAFSLTSLDGKTYTLDSLRGKVVLLNFWATWCPPCRKEMPDMEKLHQKFGDRLVVLAVSDEDRATVTGFIEKQKYTFPVLLDPDRKVNKAFGVEGIPKSFVFDRKGKLAGQAIDMRTERQFLEMLKSAGLD
jgi:peroxiredoxin